MLQDPPVLEQVLRLWHIEAVAKGLEPDLQAALCTRDCQIVVRGVDRDVSNNGCPGINQEMVRILQPKVVLMMRCIA